MKTMRIGMRELRIEGGLCFASLAITYDLLNHLMGRKQLPWPRENIHVTLLPYVIWWECPSWPKKINNRLFCKLNWRWSRMIIFNAHFTMTRIRFFLSFIDSLALMFCDLEDIFLSTQQKVDWHGEVDFFHSELSLRILVYTTAF